MAFVKLDTGILDSTLWIEREQREVFITALLMATPRELSEPAEQIEVDSLKYTDFSAPPGWYGFVPAAGVGIIRRAGVDQEIGMEALRRLGEPEPDSRSEEFDGRRMIRINGGYLILNYMKYRDKDHTAAERQARLRERRKKGVTRDVLDVTRNITQADADADADADAESTKARTFLPPLPPEQDNGRSLRSLQMPSPKSVASLIADRTGILTSGALKVFEAIARREMNNGSQYQDIVNTLGAVWIEYQDAAPELAITYGAEKFFGEGKWKDKQSWGWRSNGTYKGKTESSLDAAARVIQSFEARAAAERTGSTEAGQTDRRRLPGVCE